LSKVQSNNRTTKRLWSLEDRTQCLSQRKVLYLRMHTCMFQAVFALHGHTCCAWTLWFDSFTKCDVSLCSCGFTRKMLGVCGRIGRKGSPTLTLWGVKHGALRAKATMFSFDISKTLFGNFIGRNADSTPVLGFIPKAHLRSTQQGQEWGTLTK